jgi:predicted Zn-dependent protease
MGRPTRCRPDEAERFALLGHGRSEVTARAVLMRQDQSNANRVLGRMPRHGFSSPQTELVKYYI